MWMDRRMDEFSGDTKHTQGLCCLAFYLLPFPSSSVITGSPRMHQAYIQSRKRSREIRDTGKR